ncbi:hypothetical protein A7K91_03530 [Paenibacillus oryzae]|uniref:Uncharacterized protein n=1 Tax=Paenibacillus oryzae TaxID=1844972 RepID=A0A1A5YLL7_9BACL|nr:hypothetical protein A7K91_03530 [Paenibacillus oryzae]
MSRAPRTCRVTFVCSMCLVMAIDSVERKGEGEKGIKRDKEGERGRKSPDVCLISSSIFNA